MPRNKLVIERGQNFNGFANSKENMPFFRIRDFKKSYSFYSGRAINLYWVLSFADIKAENKVVRITNVRTHGVLSSPKRNRIIGLNIEVGGGIFCMATARVILFSPSSLYFLFYFTRTKSKIQSIKKNNFSLMVTKFLVWKIIEQYSHLL